MANKRLLLIEDDHDVAEMLLLYFQSHDFEVLHADHGEMGVEVARTRFPNLILLDVMLPDMDGYDVCVKLRHTAMTKFIPILFLTQRDERANKVRGLELGADDYITKPFDIDELRLRVQGVIHRATREHLHEVRTGLPTGPMINSVRQHKQANGGDYIELVYQVDGFREFADVYGFVAANEVIDHAGKVAQKMVGQFGTPDDFVGIMDDDLIVLTHTSNIEALDDAITGQFNDEVHAFYSFTDVDRGGVILDEGEDTEQFVPLMSLTSHRLAAIGS